MNKVFSLFLCGFLILGVAGCSSENEIKEKDNKVTTSGDVDSDNEIKDEVIEEEKYDQIIHCDLDIAGAEGSLASEDDGSYFEYYIKDEKLVKYIRFKVIPDKFDDEMIDKYVDSLKSEGWKNVTRKDRNVIITVESSSDTPEDNNPLTRSVDSVLEDLNDIEGFICYQK